MLTHVITGLLPDGQQNALTLMIARTILVRFPEVTQCDRTIDRRNHLVQTNLGGWASQGVAATDPPFRADQTGTFQCEQDLFQIRLGETRALGDVTHRGWTVFL